MNNLRSKFLLLLSITAVLVVVDNATAQPKARKFDELSIGIGSSESWWPDKYEDEERVMKRHLRRYAVQLRKEKAQAYIIGYAARVVAWEIHNRSYGEMRAGQAAEKLSAFYDHKKIQVLDGGFRETAITELWIVPPGASPPIPTPTVEPKDVSYCPYLRVSGSRYIPRPNGPLEFKALLQANGRKTEPLFSWQLSQGTIVDGQGTDRITVALPAGASGKVIAKVQVSGFSLECPLGATTAATATMIGVDYFKFDEYGSICSGDEKARLDYLAMELERNPELQAYVIFYGGRCYSSCSDDYPRHRPRYPRKGEAQERAARIKPYLVSTRGLDPDRIVVIDGGNRESWTAELWLAPKNVMPPAATPTVQSQDIEYRKGKPGKREFVVGCLGLNP